MSIYKLNVTTALGAMEIRANDKGIIALTFVPERSSELRSEPLVKNVPSEKSIESLKNIPAEVAARLHQCETELREYATGSRHTFSCQLNPRGTEFQMKIWNLMLHIPCGKTKSYGELAGEAGHPGGARAVGSACNRNPIMILIPCHRIIGAKGALTGYAGGLDRKHMLLEHERLIA